MGLSLWQAALMDEPAFGERARRRVVLQTGMLKEFLETLESG